MAIKQCSECGGKVSNRLDSCPHCGAPIEPGLVYVEPQQSQISQQVSPAASGGTAALLTLTGLGALMAVTLTWTSGYGVSFSIFDTQWDWVLPFGLLIGLCVELARGPRGVAMICGSFAALDFAYRGLNALSTEVTMGGSFYGLGLGGVALVVAAMTRE